MRRPRITVPVAVLHSTGEPSTVPLQALRDSAPVRVLAAALREHGLALMLLPAHQAADPRDRAVCSAWVDPSRAELRLGVTAGADAPAALRAGARALWLAGGFPAPASGDALGELAVDALMESFALHFCTEAGAAVATVRAVHVLCRRLSRAVPAGRERYAAAVHGWAALTAVASERERQMLLEQVRRASPTTASDIEVLAVRVGFDPVDTAARATWVLRTLASGTARCVACSRKPSRTRTG